MDLTILAAVLGAVGVLATAAFGYAGVRLTQRSSSRAAARTGQLDLSRDAREGVQAEVASLGRLIGELRVQRSQDLEDVHRLRTRVEHLEEGRDRDHARIRELADYARRLLRILSEHQIAHPPPPPGLD